MSHTESEESGMSDKDQDQGSVGVDNGKGMSSLPLTHETAEQGAGPSHSGMEEEQARNPRPPGLIAPSTPPN